MASTVYPGVILLFATTLVNVNADICLIFKAYYDEHLRKTFYNKYEVQCYRDCCGEGIYTNCCYHPKEEVNTSGVLIGVLFAAAVLFGVCLVCAKCCCRQPKPTDRPGSQDTTQTQAGEANVAFTTEVQQNPFSLPPPSYEECSSDSVHLQNKSQDKVTPGNNVCVEDDQQLPDYHSYIKVYQPNSVTANVVVSEPQSAVSDHSILERNQTETTYL